MGQNIGIVPSDAERVARYSYKVNQLFLKVKNANYTPFTPILYLIGENGGSVS